MIVVVRMRGEIGLKKDMLDTFKILGMKKIFSVKLVENEPQLVGMIKKVNNFVAWGEASEETVKALEGRRSLKPPKGGLKSKKLHYPKGSIGYHGDKINDLIKRMI